MDDNTIINTANLHLVTADETQLLSELRGAHLHEIMLDGVDFLCVSERITLLCTPESGVGRSPAHEYEELIRLSFTSLQGDERDKWYGRENIKRVEIQKTVDEISLLTSLLLFTPPVDVGPGEILGVELPAGREYGAHLLRPFTAEADAAISKFSEEKLVNQVDIGIQLRFAGGTMVALVSNGFAYFPKALWTMKAVQELLKVSLPISLESRLK